MTTVHSQGSQVYNSLLIWGRGMSKRPWMPLYVAEFVATTTHLSAAESGAYALLLMFHWTNGGLPKDEKSLRQITKMTRHQWSRSRDVLCSFFGYDWGSISNSLVLSCGRKNNRPSISIDIRRTVVERDGSICVYCGDTEGPFHLDHILPWSRGGEHSIENLVVSCKYCNCSKGARTLEEWVQ